MKKLILSKGNGLGEHKRIKLYHWIDNKPSNKSRNIVYNTIRFILMVGNYRSDIVQFLMRNFEIKVPFSHKRRRLRRRRLNAYYRSYPRSTWNAVINQLITRVGGDGASLNLIKQTFLTRLKAKQARKRAQHRARKAKKKARKRRAEKARITRQKRAGKRLKKLRKDLYLSKCKDQAIDEIKIMKGGK